MTKQAGFKRRVRARMAKTGESYATARSRLLAAHPGTKPDDSPLAPSPPRGWVNCGSWARRSTGSAASITALGVSGGLAVAGVGAAAAPVGLR
jgi:hypothetical protein